MNAKELKKYFIENQRQNLFQPIVGQQQMHFCHATMKSRIQLSNHPLALWSRI